MSNFYILRGAPASGKSTWIVDNGLGGNVVSSDAVRLQKLGIAYTDDGRPYIPQTNQKEVWATVKDKIEERMARHEPVILDSTAKTISAIRAYEDIAKKYGYDINLVDFSNVPKDVCLERNKTREEFRRVPSHVIENFYDYNLPPLPAGYNVVSPDGAKEKILREIEVSKALENSLSEMKYADVKDGYDFGY